MKRTPKQRSYDVNFDALNEDDKEMYKKIYEEYDAISIYALREVARRMGLRSATTLDKRTLVKKMTELRIASTVYYPPEKTTVSPVTNQEVEELTNDYLMKSVVISPQQRKGILDITAEGAWARISGFVQRDADIFVPMLMVNEHKLLPGDEISGQVRFLEKAGRFGMFKLDMINGVRIDCFVRKTLEDPQPPLGIIKMEKGSRSFNALNAICPFCKGQRKLIIGLGAVKLDNLAREISTKLSHSGFETINMFLDETPEGMSETSILPGTTLVLPCDNSDKYDDSVLLAVNHAKRVAAHGRHIAIILNNADVLSESTLRTVYGAGRLTGAGSITTVIVSSTIELNQAINILSRTANSITIFKNNFGDEPLIDLHRSFSDSEKQLSSSEIQTLKDCRRQIDDQYISVKDFMSAYDILLAGNKE